MTNQPFRFYSMANPFLSIPIFLFFLISILLLSTISISQPLQLIPSQSQILLNLQNLLNYPQSFITNWNETTDFCNSVPNPSLTIVCYEENVTQLHISGVSWSQPQLPQNFSSNLLFTNLANLPSLKVLSLVSLGLWGPLPTSIASLSSLEILNLTSNYFSGDIPVEVSSLVNLQTLVLDNNRFNGEIPVWFASLPSLTVLSLSSNSFHGSVPLSLARLQNLRILKLGMNNLSGEVPNLSKLTNLQILNLEENKLGPHFPYLSNKLIHLVLRKNMFGFIIPENLTSFYHLERLDISMNGFRGPFKPQLMSLPSLSYLDISDNKLTGFLFENTSCGDVLDYVNLSLNRLTGDLPTCCLSQRMVFQYDGNCLNHSQGQKQHPFVYCHNEALAVRFMPRDRSRKPVRTVVIVLALVGGICFGLVLCSLLFVFAGRLRSLNLVKTPQTRMILESVNPANTLKMLTDARYISETIKIGALGLPPYRTFVLEELKEATNDFSVFNLIGEGSLGKVYKGTLADGTMVAIKSLKMSKKHSTQLYARQIESISKLRHCHLISTIGHCFECCPDDSSVVTVHRLFEFVPNWTTLRDCISERTVAQKLRWTQRIAAAIGVAKGIQFLHTGIVPGIFSNNLKITDVMFDHNLIAKISTRNISFLNEDKRMVGYGTSSSESKVKIRDGNEDKKDIYDFGVILLELIMGRAIMSANAILVARDLLRVSLKADDVVGRRGIIDPSIQKDCSNESLKTIMEICLRCLLDEPGNRPSVEDIVWNLQFAAQVQDSWMADSKASCQGSPNMS